jgi:hypothetical protein
MLCARAERARAVKQPKHEEKVESKFASALPKLEAAARQLIEENQVLADQLFEKQASLVRFEEKLLLGEFKLAQTKQDVQQALDQLQQVERDVSQLLR